MLATALDIGATTTTRDRTAGTRYAASLPHPDGRFTHKGILYSWQADDLPKGDKTILIKMANEAIAAGPR